MKRPVCKVNYHKFKIPELEELAYAVNNGIYSNATVFATPPITAAALTALQAALNVSYADYMVYGVTQKTIFLNDKKNLIKGLDALADYVNAVAEGDRSMIILSGFVPSSETTHPAPTLTKITKFSLKLTDNLGEIAVVIPAYVGVSGVTYTCICVEGAPLKNPVLVNGMILLQDDDPKIRVDFNKSRNKVIVGLHPGSQYFVYVFASNTSGVSSLSDPKSIWSS